MAFWRRTLDDRRQAALRKAPPGPLRDYLQVPFEDGRMDWEYLLWTGTRL